MTGLIVPAGDPRALGEAIGTLLADPARVEAMGRAAARRWARAFTAERMVRETEDVYRAALARVPAGARVGAAAMPERHAAP